ncbi:MAG: LppX_LprAFG lipoprotein, partial [Chloroflexota bacterium]
QWLTNPLTQRWEVAPANWGYNPAVFFDSRNGIASLLQRAEGLTRLADESLEGKAHYRLAGKIAGNDIAPLTAYMITGSDVSFTLWVGADDFLLRKVHISEKDASATDTTEWDIALSAFDKAVAIEPPIAQ